MNDKINGFILSETDYKDNDVLLQVLTKEYGVLSLIGKAAKKVNSKNHFLPMCVYEFLIDYKENKTIFSIHNHKLIHNYFEDKNIDMISFKNILLELTLKNRDIDTYDEILFVFDKLNDKNKYLLGSMYVSYLIKQFGITPQVDECVVCGNKRVVSFSSRYGGFLCNNHLNGEDIKNVEALKKIRLIIKGDFSHYDILRDFEYSYKDFCIILDFFLFNSDIKLKSYDFYRTIN